MSETELKKVRSFVAACRRQWPGAKIVNIWPPAGGDATGANGARAGCVSGQERREEKAMDMRKYASGSFIGVDDLRDGPRREKIIDVVEGKYEKANLVFESGDKLSLNATNLKVLLRAFGPDSKTWAGQPVETYIGELEFQGEAREGVRIRPITAETETAPKTKKPAGEMDDEIPF